MQTEFTLLSPPGAQTSTSIALVWDKPLSGMIAYYKVYLNGRQEAISLATDYTLEELQPGTQYEAQVAAIASGGTELLRSNVAFIQTKPEGETLNALRFGAKGDGHALNTPAIQSAIDACPPGGTVLLPAGTYISGALFLKSDMTLRLEVGCRLVGSSDTADYPLLQYRWEGREHLCYASLLNTANSEGTRLQNITIEGGGVIDANGTLLRELMQSEGAGERGRAICLREVDGVYLKDITVRHSPAWCVHPIYCNGVSVNNVKIHTRRDEYGHIYDGVYNGDGLDPDSCRDVYIFRCHIASQDDCIAIKSGRDEDGRRVGIPTQNVRITNCSFASGFGVAVGSEMSGGVKNVLVQDCRFNGTHSIAAIKAPRGRGAVVEDIRFEDCTLLNQQPEHEDTKWFRGGLYIDQYYSHEEYDPTEHRPAGEGTSRIRNILFKNIVLDTRAGNAIFLAGLPESPLQNITLQNVTALGRYGMKAYNIEGLHTDNLNVTAREGKAQELHNVK